ncbi:MAG: BON domain-containing protein [Terriglobia bacterium]
MKQRRGGVYGLAVVLVLALVAGACSHRPDASSDQAVASAIQAKLYQNPDLKPLSVNVASNGGVVTLTGAVNAPLQKLAIDDLARNTQGVSRVIDQLTVEQVAGAPDATSASSTSPQEEATPAPRTTHWRNTKSAKQRAENAKAPRASGAAAESREAAREAADSAPPATDTAAAAPQPAPQAAPPPPPQSVNMTIPAGTAVIVRMVDPISSATAQLNQEYAATLFSPLVVNNTVVVPQGANARVRVVEVKSAGHFKGQSELKIALVRLSVHGQNYSVESGYYQKTGSSRGVNSAEKIGGGGALGALIGGLIGHGKGAGIGAAIGAAGGAIDQQATHGQQVTIPSEAEVNFTLKSPVTVTLPPGGSSQ